MGDEDISSDTNISELLDDSQEDKTYEVTDADKIIERFDIEDDLDLQQTSKVSKHEINFRILFI